MAADDPLVLSKAHSDEIARILRDLAEKTGASLALLVRQDGKALGSHGAAEGLDLDKAAALIAGIVANAGELAQLLGEAQFMVWYDRPEGRRISSALVDEDTILALFHGAQSEPSAVAEGVTRFGAMIARILAAARRSVEVQRQQDTTDDRTVPDIDDSTRKQLDTIFGD